MYFNDDINNDDSGYNVNILDQKESTCCLYVVCFHVFGILFENES